MNKKNKLRRQEGKPINQNEIEQKLLTLQNDLAYLSEEIEEMVSDFQRQPEKYDSLNLRELMHAHNGEISRIKNEIDDFENKLLVEKSRPGP
tara:strand:+ start:407 stop:682 length:276 start_codon:yes stop_codon:yes gene_type:complete